MRSAAVWTSSTSPAAAACCPRLARGHGVCSTSGSCALLQQPLRPSAQSRRARAILCASSQDGARGSVSTNAVVADRPEVMTADSSATSTSAAALTSSPSAKAGGRVVLESEDELRSNWKHRAWVGGANMLLAALAYQGVAEVQGPGDVLALLATAVGAYVLADLGTGIYHHAVDNYGDANTPIVGGQIAAFQGHHQRPWTITEREFCNNVHKVFQPTVPVSMALLALSGSTPYCLDFGLAWFLWLVAMSQQFHAWSHMKRSELPAPVTALQEAGLLISRKAHGAHHKAPFEGNYCIVSGLWNDVLDANGAEDSFFRNWERLLLSLTGVEPRCWSEPNYEWVDHYFKDGSNEELAGEA